MQVWKVWRLREPPQRIASNSAQCSHWVRNNPASCTGKLHNAWRVRQGTQKGLISVVGNDYYQPALFQFHLMNFFFFFCNATNSFYFILFIFRIRRFHLMNFKSKTQNIRHLIQNYQACIKTGIYDPYRHTLEMLWVQFKTTTIKQMS